MYHKSKFLWISLMLFVVTVAITTVPEKADALAIRGNAGFATNTFAGNDDLSIFVNTGINFDFFGINGPSLWLNNNGNVTFGSALPTFTPFGITSGSTAMIAPFFADVDTRSSTPVTYGTDTVGGRNAFGINWVDVEHYDQLGPLNSFQLVMVDRSDVAAGDFDFEFNYDSILWEAGQASGSDGAGLGGTSARAGFTNGAGNFFELAGSGFNGAFLGGGANDLVANSLNSNVAGRYSFSVRNGVVESPPTDPVPEPATIALLGIGLVGLAGAEVRRRRKKKTVD